MKVIQLVLFIIISVAAQENKEYYVILTSNIGPLNICNGHLRLTQRGSEDPVQIDAEIGSLPYGWYRFEVHEVNENTTNCDSLGPIVDLGFDTLFDLLDEYIDISGYQKFTKVTQSLTLEPNTPRTLIGRAIAFFQEPLLGSNQSEGYLRVACGSVLTLSGFNQRTHYYKERIARDPKFNVARIWF